MEFSSLHQPYGSNRFCLTAKNGVVSTGSALASAAGLEILKKGGNAVDAAVATAAALTVVEPTSNGLGSDAFAIVWMNEKLYGLNGSGYSPYEIDVEEVRRRFHGKMPKHGFVPVMVPGAVSSWEKLVERFGNLSLKENLEPAIHYAKEGYPLSPMLAHMWEKCRSSYEKEFGDQKEYQEWFKTFTNNGKPYQFGDIVKLENHARSLELIANQGAKVFYQGEIADQFIKQSNRDGGYFTKRDLAEYEAKWVDPISVSYHGYDVFEIPPNGQGIVALMALNMLNEFEFDEKEVDDVTHKQIEAIKKAFADAKHMVTDPDHMKLPFDYYLSSEYGKARAQEMKENAELPNFVEPPKSGTVYLCTADKDGNMVSYIQSNYMDFGSGIVLEGYGVALQNRGADFSLNQEDANVLAPHKKSYHTIIPGFLMKGNRAIGPFGVMGGYMQPQGHVQVLMNLIDFHLNPQMALDAPRFQWLKGNRVEFEPSFNKQILEALRKRGHEVEIGRNVETFGRGQMIYRLENGVYVVGTESRTDSNIACY